MIIVGLPFLRRASVDELEREKLTATYRDQLERLAADHRDGQISDEEAANGRAEIGRRLLAAQDQALRTGISAPPIATALAVVGILAAIGGAVAVYTQIGAPELRDQPLAARSLGPNRPSQAEMVAQVADEVAKAAREPNEQEALMLSQLEEILQERSEDPIGHQHLANLKKSLGQFDGAALAQARVVELRGDQASADEVANLAEMMILATKGYVSPQADQALVRALRLDPDHVSARYYSGVSMAQAGKADIAMGLWTRLWSESSPEAPWRTSLRDQILALSDMSGIPAPPILVAGSSPLEAMDADQSAAVAGMVEGLAERLANEGGAPEDWARLIRSLTVLGQTDRATAIIAEAETTFAGDEAALSLIRSAPSTVQPQ